MAGRGHSILHFDSSVSILVLDKSLVSQLLGPQWHVKACAFIVHDVCSNYIQSSSSSLLVHMELPSDNFNSPTLQLSMLL
jgi:hypothetical protein